ncbi:hypothetical protein GCM10014715_86420 [Streptomyces spiralis]|uniref:Uncharacterized protein n=1 Tax=Streptomyces spiralis TaxID=66376 RepID=A0A919E6K2_9ACTN|nr:hypothetical protein GCM10014715_86420 [Streptomyces spiralis]
MSWIAAPEVCSPSRMVCAVTETIEPSMVAMICPVSSTASIGPRRAPGTDGGEEAIMSPSMGFTARPVLKKYADLVVAGDG